jgi:hypothetical protein
VFDASLCGTQNMPGGVQRHAHAVDVDGFTVVDGLKPDIAQPDPQDLSRRLGRKIISVSRPRMVAMGMRDDGLAHRSPGVDVEVARRAVQTFRPLADQVGAVGHRIVITTSYAQGVGAVLEEQERQQ